MSIQEPIPNPVIICAESNQELFWHAETGRREVQVDCGQCGDCGLYFHVDHLETPDSLVPEKWPVFYQGFSCKGCARGEPPL